jgi:hypothetical protein
LVAGTSDRSAGYIFRYYDDTAPIVRGPFESTSDKNAANGGSRGGGFYVRIQVSKLVILQQNAFLRHRDNLDNSIASPQALIHDFLHFQHTAIDIIHVILRCAVIGRYLPGVSNLWDLEGALAASQDNPGYAVAEELLRVEVERAPSGFRKAILMPEQNPRL